MKKKAKDKLSRYMRLIDEAIIKMLDEHKEVVEEFDDDESWRLFLYAMGVAYPAQFYHFITDRGKDYLSYNQYMNTLCMEYINKNDDNYITDEEKLKVINKYVFLLGKILNDNIPQSVLNEINGNPAEAKYFFHTLANVIPTMAYNDMMGRKYSILQFNHLANLLAFTFLMKNPNENISDKSNLN